MFEKRRTTIFVIANLIIINWIIITFLNLKYPIVGCDYVLTISSMLDSAIFFRLNGLYIQWFTPSFGGGIPAFPNPNNMQFSLATLLTVFLPPWAAVVISAIVYISLGFVACEYFLRHTLGLNWTSSLLGAVFFSANGFIMERVVVGHMGYSTFPLLPIFLVALLDKSFNAKSAAATLGLLIGLILHYAGFFILVIFGLSIFITIPIVYIFNSTLFDWRNLLIKVLFSGLVGLFVSVSKLSAVYSFMRFFPRTISDYYNTPLLIGVFGLFLQLLGTMSLVPLLTIVGLNPDTLPNYVLAATGAHYGFWETDMSVSPIVFIILLIGLRLFFNHPRKHFNQLLSEKKRGAFLFLIFSLWIAIEFVLAKGLFYPVLRHLPVLSSLHVNLRFTAAFIFPLIFVASLVYDKWINTQQASNLSAIFLVTNILTVLPLGAYFVYRQDTINCRIYDVSGTQKIFEQMQSGASFEVLKIGVSKNNSDALLTHVSNLNLYEPAFGYVLENYHPQLHMGSIWDISNGYYNMTDPTGFIYPEVNNNQPFERFHMEDKETLALFAKHLRPKWKIPDYQIVFDWISSLSFLIVAIYLMFCIFRLVMPQKQ